MKIGRTELLGVLKLLSPALASSNRSQLPELSCLWFDGEKVSAFNDVLGIRATFKTEFTGGLIGDKLIGVLERSRSKDVDLTAEGDDALLKIGNARIKFSRRPIEDWFWTPEVPDSEHLSASRAVKDAINAVLLSVGNAAVQNAEQRGVTVIANGKAVDLYSTDAVSLSRMHVDIQQRALDNGARLILPTPFCEQLRSLKNDAELRFDEGAVYCTVKVDVEGKSLDVLIFSKLVGDDDPVSFEEVISEHLTDFEGVEIPSQLKLRAERAMVILGDQPVEIEIDDNQMYLYAQTPYGEVDDVIKIGDHPKIKVKLDMSLLHRALGSCDRFAVAKNGVTMTGKQGLLHVVSTK